MQNVIKAGDLVRLRWESAFSDDERAMIGIVLDTEHHAATIMWAPDMRVLREGVGDVEVFDEPR
jgi:hypothetical protein